MLACTQPVHRIDKETGGLLLIAKTKPALVHLTAQFAQKHTGKDNGNGTGGVYKRYCAMTMSDRPVVSPTGSIEAPPPPPPSFPFDRAPIPSPHPIPPSQPTLTPC